MVAQKRIRTSIGAAVLAGALSITLSGAGAASAAPTATAAAPAADAPTGWVRVAHLSPDTKSVDVQLTALAGGDVVFELDKVGYGAVSDYQQLPEGTYVVSMVPNGSAEGTAPIISESIEVTANEPMTVAALGTNENLETKVFSDDLTNPAPGESRVRVVQASTTADSVDITTTTGLSIAEEVAFGTVTGYATVPAGPWNLELTATGDSSAASVNLPTGTVNTLFVLDNADGGLTIKAVLDSAAVGEVPEGGVQTGGGAMQDAVSAPAVHTLAQVLTSE